MSVEAEDIHGNTLHKDTQEQILLYLKVIAFLLAEQQDENLTQLLSSMRNV